MKAYWIALSVVTGLLLVLMIPGAALATAILTMGLGLAVIVPLPYAALVLWVFLPAALLWSSRARWPALVSGVGVLAFLWIAPARIADRLALADLADRGDIPAKPVDLPPAPGVEIRRHAGSIALPAYGLGEEGVAATIAGSPCDDLCERLLFGGAGWVRVVLDGDEARSRTEDSDDLRRSTSFLVLGDAQACRAANPDLAAPSCVLYATDNGRRADVTLTFGGNSIPYDDNFPLEPYFPVSSATFRAFRGDPEDDWEVWRATRIAYFRPIPGLFGIDTGALGSAEPGGGLELGRTRESVGRIDLAAALMTMGLPLGPSRRPLDPGPDGRPRRVGFALVPDAFDAARVASLLAVGPVPGHAYSREHNEEIEGWQMRLEAKTEVTPTERRLFCDGLAALALARSPRWDGELSYWTTEIMEQHGIACP